MNLLPNPAEFDVAEIPLFEERYESARFNAVTDCGGADREGTSPCSESDHPFVTLPL
jgi:hypothetical protein